MMALLLLSTILAGYSDYLMKIAADRRNLYYLIAVWLLWTSTIPIWYYLFTQERYIILSCYFIVLTTFKEVLVSFCLGEKLSNAEMIGVALIIAGSLVSALKK